MTRLVVTPPRDRALSVGMVITVLVVGVVLAFWECATRGWSEVSVQVWGILLSVTAVFTWLAHVDLMRELDEDT